MNKTVKSNNQGDKKMNPHSVGAAGKGASESHSGMARGQGNDMNTIRATRMLEKYDCPN